MEKSRTYVLKSFFDTAEIKICNIERVNLLNQKKKRKLNNYQLRNFCTLATNPSFK